MVEEACYCDQGFEVEHTHLWEHLVVDGRVVAQDHGAIRMWVDWRAAYRALEPLDGSQDG